jgi:hypothetical protein
MAHGRPLGLPAACVAVLIATLAGNGGGGVAHADGGLPVDLFLATEPSLAPDARHALMREAERIWRREGIQLRWPSTYAPRASAVRMRVLVMQRQADGDDDWPVGEILPTGAGGTVPMTPAEGLAIASVAGAQRVLHAAGHADAPPQAARRLGVVLGRAVAHEVGHYLLGTASHSRLGLMRRGIDAREFADLHSRSFALDPEAGRWVRQSLAGSVRRGLRLMPFSYQRD